MNTNETAVVVVSEVTVAPGLFVRKGENRSWDFRPFGQSMAVRKHRIERKFLRSNAWKVASGLMSRKEAKRAARRYAAMVVAADAYAGCKCAVRMGSRTWLTVL